MKRCLNNLLLWRYLLFKIIKNCQKWVYIGMGGLFSLETQKVVLKSIKTQYCYEM